MVFEARHLGDAGDGQRIGNTGDDGQDEEQAQGGHVLGEPGR
jgi:hypothetical protein